jgi:hypothetical protein
MVSTQSNHVQSVSLNDVSSVELLENMKTEYNSMIININMKYIRNSEGALIFESIPEKTFDYSLGGCGEPAYHCML